MLINDAIRSLRDLCVLRHFSINTEKTYVHWLGRYGRFLKDPGVKGSTAERKLETFLTRLALSGVAAATQNQAFSALLCFYREVLKVELTGVDALRARRQPGIRQCPSHEEVTQLLATVADLYGYPTRLIVHLLYGCGLRVSEPLNLRIKYLDLSQGRLYLYQTKGNKGRVVLFPRCLAEPLERQLVKARTMAAQDRAAGIPVPLPGLLAKKYPWAARAERWAWLFPSHTICADPRSHALVRWRCHENNVQRAVRTAACRCRLEGLTPHLLRHAFASHALHGGASVRDLQVVLGHSNLETTMLYLHAETERVVSPIHTYAPDPVT